MKYQHPGDEQDNKTPDWFTSVAYACVTVIVIAVSVTIVGALALGLLWLATTI
ncbi:MAG: hypothetical protein ACRDQA_05930 [Nocardioidaceae bacterium]